MVGGVSTTVVTTAGVVGTDGGAEVGTGGDPRVGAVVKLVVGVGGNSVASVGFGTVGRIGLATGGFFAAVFAVFAVFVDLAVDLAVVVFVVFVAFVVLAAFAVFDDFDAEGFTTARWAAKAVTDGTSEITTLTSSATRRVRGRGACREAIRSAYHEPRRANGCFASVTGVY